MAYQLNTQLSANILTYPFVLLPETALAVIQADVFTHTQFSLSETSLSVGICGTRTRRTFHAKQCYGTFFLLDKTVSVKYFHGAYYVSGAILGTEETAVNKRQICLPTQSFRLMF